jgi:radical SAM protein with 4Fe4S-binding SPASM domain
MSSLFRVGLLLTFRCNAECRHCFFASGPHRDEVMSTDLGIKAIDEAAVLGAEWISFTGGEPFLELALLEPLIAFANELGLKTEIVSNGFWAETPEKAESALMPLWGLGLDVLNLSIDDFHQEYVPIKHVKNAYDAAKKLGLKIVIMTTTSKNNNITAEKIPELLQDEKILIIGRSHVRDPNALLVETPVTPAGRGESIEDPEYMLMTEIQCNEALRDIGIGPDGSVYPCCGPLAARITLGNLKDSRLKEILNRAKKDEFLASIRKGKPISGAFITRCHACISLLE